MVAGEFLRKATAELASAGISTARLDSLVLLESTLNTNRTQILAHEDLPLSIAQSNRLQNCLERRLQHEPLAYILNRTEFYGRTFYVDHRVLEPRPESESIIDLVKELEPRPNLVVDVGTGSGALAITLALESPNVKVIAIDCDPGCLVVARKNAHLLNAHVTFKKADLIEPLMRSQKLEGSTLLCNLPYVPDSFQINPAAMREPRLAIFGGPDGLDLYRRLFGQLAAAKCTPKWVLTESMPPQQRDLAQIAHRAGFVLEKSEDFVQAFRTTSAF